MTREGVSDVSLMVSRVRGESDGTDKIAQPDWWQNGRLVAEWQTGGRKAD